MKFFIFWDKKRKCFVFPCQYFDLHLDKDFLEKFKCFFIEKYEHLKKYDSDFHCTMNFYKSIFTNDIVSRKKEYNFFHNNFIFFDDETESINPVVLLKNHIFYENIDNIKHKKISMDSLISVYNKSSSIYDRSIFNFVNLKSFYKKSNIAFMKFIFLLSYVFYNSADNTSDYIENFYILPFYIKNEYDMIKQNISYVIYCDRDQSICIKNFIKIFEKCFFSYDVKDLHILVKKYQIFFNKKYNFDIFEKMFLYINFFNNFLYDKNINFNNYFFILMRYNKKDLKKINKLIQEYNIDKTSVRCYYLKRKIMMTRFLLINYIVNSVDFVFLINIIMDRNYLLLNDSLFMFLFNILVK